MPENKTINIVIAGHTGLQKKSILDNLSKYIYEKDKKWCKLRESSDEKSREDREIELVQIYGVEDSIYRSILKSTPGVRRTSWEKSFTKTRNKWLSRSKHPKFCFLTLHISWQVESQFFTPLSWRYPPDNDDILLNFLRDEFKPQRIITLIDDIYTAQRKIRKNKYHFRLLELLRWRNVETLLADTLAQQVVPAEYFLEDTDRYPFEHSPIVAVRHPRKMLYSLLTDKKKPRVYASYPMSEVRRMAKTLDTMEPFHEINSFRKFVRDHFIVFDPVTIDERPLNTIRERYDQEFEKEKREKLESAMWRLKDILTGKEVAEDELKRKISRRAKAFLSLKQDAEITLSKDDRWPIEEEDALCGDEFNDIEDISLGEIIEITAGSAAGGERHFSEIDRQIQTRDYRLIEQADYVVVYRPTLNKNRWSTGTFSEARYAQFVNREVFVIKDTTDAPLNSPPFGMDFPEFNVYEGSNLGDADQREEVFRRVADAINEDIKRIFTIGLR